MPDALLAAPTEGLPADALDLRCPLFPATLTEALDLAADPDTIDIDVVTQMVERDPVLLAQLLTTVNSAYYGLGRTITSPARAVVMLGPKTVLQLVAGTSLSRLRSSAAPEASDRLVRHSVATAYLAQLLTEHTPAAGRPAQSGEAFTAGLLHDFGKLVLLHNFPQGAAPIYLGALDAVDDGLFGCRARERAMFACDHTEAGAAAAAQAKFPTALLEVIRHHHDPSALVGSGVERAAGYLLRVVATASCAAGALGYAAGPARDDCGLALETFAMLDLDLAEDDVRTLIQEAAPRLHQYVEALLGAA